MYETKDGMWVFPTNPYPQIHLKTAVLLNVPSTPAAVTRAIKGWNGEDLEQAAVEAGGVMPLARPLHKILEMDVFRDGLRERPLISVEKIADSDPRPFTPDCRDPLSGVRALGLVHVIA